MLSSDAAHLLSLAPRRSRRKQKKRRPMQRVIESGGADILVCHGIGEWRSTLLPIQFESARRAKARTRTLMTDKNVCPTKERRTRKLRSRQECLLHETGDNCSTKLGKDLR